jgi:acetyl-CoA C-acetyltransferase
MALIDPRTPVLIGAGQFTHRGGHETCPFPIELCGIAVAAAAQDAGLAQADLAHADCVAVVGFTVDEPTVQRLLPVPRAANPPKALATHLGIEGAHLIETATGGNMPQSMVNEMCARIARGENDLVVLAGAEFLGSLQGAIKHGRMDLVARHDRPDDRTQERFGSDRPGCSDLEEAYGLGFPTNTYALFENGLRAHLGVGLNEHQASLGQLFAPFTRVAAGNPYAWYRQERTPEALVTVGPANRMVGFPYPKYLNAILQVDQSAALLLASYGKALDLGVEPDRMVFLHGCSDVNEIWSPIDRLNYHSSPAMALAGREVLAMAGCSIDQIDAFDLYSCFPVAVELACRELGIEPSGGRSLTLTGGLPYFGGPGNNYSMHAIAEAIAFCRAHPGKRALVTANGWFLTKQAMGIYSSVPVEGGWQRADPAIAQAQIDGLKSPPVVEIADPGAATIETYTVVHGRDGPRMGIVVGRDGQNRRFLANTPKGDAAIMADLQAREGVGRTGQVSQVDGRNVFVPD